MYSVWHGSKLVRELGPQALAMLSDHLQNKKEIERATTVKHIVERGPMAPMV